MTNSEQEIELAKHDRDYAIGMLERKDAEIDRLKRQVEVLRDGISAVQVLPYHQVWPTLREALAAADKIAKGD